MCRGGLSSYQLHVGTKPPRDVAEKGCCPLRHGSRFSPNADSEEVEEDAQDGEEHDDRVHVERLSLDARREEVALELLDQDVGHDGQHGGGRDSKMRATAI